MATHIIDKITDLLGNVFTFKDNSGNDSSHTHNIANVNGLQSALNNKADKSTVGYFRTKSQHISMGANLVVNGNGRNGDNYNFTSFKRYPTIVTNGAACSFGFNSYSREDEYMSCDFTKKILLSVDIKNLAVQPTTPIHRIYIEEYDIDKNAVRALNVMYGVGTLTELSQDLKPGDTVVHLNDLSNNNWKSSTTHHRGFIFWNYKNSFGYQYEPETYSRNVYPASDSTSLWEAANVDQANNTITLNSPWSGPLISAGTKVSRRSSGTTFPYPANASFNDLNWHHLVGTMNGVASVGTSERTNKFSQGVAYFKVGVYPSNLTVAPTTDDRRAVLANLSVYELPDVSKGINGTLPIANVNGLQTALDGKLDVTGTADRANWAANADTVDGYHVSQLVTNDFFYDWKADETETFSGTAAKATADASGNTITSTYATKSELTTHTSNTSNPHNVTKSQVGLGNVDNTSDTDKPISTATQTALNGKQDSISDIATIRSNATNGQTAYGWGNHANAGYLTEADLSGYETSAHAASTYATISSITGLKDSRRYINYGTRSWNNSTFLSYGYVGNTTTWDSVSYTGDVTMIEVGDVLVLDVENTSLGSNGKYAHFLLFIKVTAKSTTSPTGVVIACVHSNEQATLDVTNVNANNFVIPGIYNIFRGESTSYNWPYTGRGVLLVSAGTTNGEKLTTDNAFVEQRMGGINVSYIRTCSSGTWNSWRWAPKTTGMSQVGSSTQPVYVNSSGQVTACGFSVKIVSTIPAQLDANTLYIS